VLKKSLLLKIYRDQAQPVGNLQVCLC